MFNIVIEIMHFWSDTFRFYLAILPRIPLSNVSKKSKLLKKLTRKNIE